MDDIYEFENPKYRVTSMQIKAIAYDIVIEITKKKMEASNSEELKNKLTNINDKLIELTESLEEQLEALDECDQELENQNDEKKAVSSPKEKDEVPKQEPIEKQEEKMPEPVEQKPQQEEPIITSNTVKIVPIPSSEKKEEEKQPIIEEKEQKPVYVEIKEQVPPAMPQEPEITPKVVEGASQDKKEEPVKEPQEEKQMINIQPALEIKADPNLTLEETPNQDFPKVVATAETHQLKQFKKTTKSLSKAIMVRQSQLENLRKSRIRQENLLKEKGVFTGEEEIEQAQSQVVGTEKKVLPDAVERQIEDLTVKANIYYNEGETEKAQELYNQIRELSKQAETKE